VADKVRRSASRVRLVQNHNGTATVSTRIRRVAAGERAPTPRNAGGWAIAGDLLAGASTRDVAKHLVVSENTVQDHLKSIFIKTTTRNRRALVARGLGT
jgi:DNA-binding NarL/FixJ family response regulator